MFATPDSDGGDFIAVRVAWWSESAGVRWQEEWKGQEEEEEEEDEEV